MTEVERVGNVFQVRLWEVHILKSFNSSESSTNEAERLILVLKNNNLLNSILGQFDLMQ